MPDLFISLGDLSSHCNENLDDVISFIISGEERSSLKISHLIRYLLMSHKLKKILPLGIQPKTLPGVPNLNVVYDTCTVQLQARIIPDESICL